MGDLGQFGRALIGLGAALLAVGLLVVVVARFAPGGRLPGNLVVSRGPLTCVVPLATSLLLSVVLTILLNLWARR